MVNPIIFLSRVEKQSCAWKVNLKCVSYAIHGFFFFISINGGSMSNWCNPITRRHLHKLIMTQNV